MIDNIAFGIHGHFYQPFREDPLTGQIPTERGAVPFNNWNELIFHHCYKPNTDLRNFERISFNIGPTLFDWMEKNYPETVKEIIQQENYNYEIYGVGNALAQPYHHTILPLSKKEDKVNQIVWGILDFKKRFGHQPAGMWLPETAVDLESLQIMAENGIEFTILAPWQAKTQNLDVSQPYWVELQNNLQMGVFFYHKELSTKISFEPNSTINADQFASNEILPLFENSTSPNQPKFILVASDGELYGHHQPYRDKFLDHLMNGALTERKIKHSFPALWIRQHPPQNVIKIWEKTSWSCHHGVARWSTGCDCTPLSDWKRQLRFAIDAVAQIVDHEYEMFIKEYTKDIWAIRKAYWEVIKENLDFETFVKKYLNIAISDEEKEKLTYFLTAQVERQRMYTSCGWFFDDFDRIEPQNVVSYAAHAIYWIDNATHLNYYEKVLPYFEKILSQRTLVSGDVIFSQQYQRSKQFFPSTLKM